MIRISRGFLATTMVILSGIAACDSRGGGSGDAGDDPMEALGSGSFSADFDEAYWGEQRRSNPELWARATAYCDGRDGTEYPNCRPVLSLLLLERTLDRPTTTSPGFDGSMDMSGRADSAQSRLDSLGSPD
jgi:hypothetical protein